MMTSKRFMITALIAGIAYASLGDTFYLHATKEYTISDSNKSHWWNAPTGGTSMSALGAGFAGNTFNLNGYTYKTENTGSAVSFDGTIRNSNARLMIYSQNLNLAALDWSAAGSRGTRDISTRRDNIGLNISNLNVSNKLIIRANSIELNLNLHATTLTGNGTISFGTDPEESVSVWGLDIDHSDFTGKIEVNIGKLQINDSLALSRATLAMTSGNNALVLANNAIFGAVTYNGTPLAEDTYTAGQLNTLFSTTRFSGAGTLSILPEVDTIRVETKADGSGTVVPSISLQSGESVTNYAIARDAGGAFISNTTAAWSISSVSGFVAELDLSPAADGKSAVFTGGSYGTAQITADGNAMNLVPSGLISVDAAPLSSPTRPFIWATASERSGILQKITTNAWATSMARSLIARVEDDLVSYESDRDGYLRELPVNWAHTPTPIFYTTEAQVRGPWSVKLNMALDCSMLYYLTGNSRYAALAADVLHNSIQSLLNTPLAPAPYGGWTMHDGQWLKESRIIGSQMPLIYDFLHGYLLSNPVWEVDLAATTTFSISDAQTIFDQCWKNCRDWGLGGNNWGSLMASCMIHNIMALDNVTAREDAIDFFIYTGAPRQDSLSEDHDHFDVAAPFSVYPESLGYAKAVVTFDTYYMALIERYDPARTMYAEFSLIPESLHRITQLNYPNHDSKILFGDGHRKSPDTIDYLSAEIVYQHAKKLGRTDLTDVNGGLINQGIASGAYDRSRLEDYEDLNLKVKALPLLWSEANVSESPYSLDVYRSDTLPYAGLALQRNLSPNGNPNFGLMCFVQGAGHVHSHASGMNMELYGLGEVLGVKAYGRTKYTRAFASANTVVVNGYSRGAGGWIGVGINTVQVEAMEPAAREPAVSSNISFTCSSFLDNKGSGAEANQQRTMAIIRTSPTTGYYVDLFRSDSALGGEYHDYIYHNIGDSLSLERNNGTPISLTSEPNRFQNDTDANASPGWGSFTGTMASGTVTDSIRAQFTTQPTGTPSPIYMDLHIPGDAGREYATALAPSDGESVDPYDDLPIPTLVMRKNGEAWDDPFALVFEPHAGSANGGSVQQVSTLTQGGSVVGLKVESLVGGSNVVQYVISNTGANGSFNDAASGISFDGRFAVVTEHADGSGELYIGDGSYLAFGPLSVMSQSGNNTQASVLFDSNLQTTVTANDPVFIDTETGNTTNTFYLHASIPLNPSPGLQDPSWWWDDPVDGNQMTATDRFAGNLFSLNNYTFRSENTASAAFDGTLLKGDESVLIYAVNYDLGGLDVSTNSVTESNGLVMRKDNMKVSISTLNLDGDLLVRANSIERNMDLSILQLTGSGELEFGRDDDETNQVWGLDIGNTNFAGTINLRYGNLYFNSPLSLADAGLVVQPTGSTVVLSNSVSLGWMAYDATALDNGTYTASELNAVFGTPDLFSGDGSLTISGIDAGAGYQAWIALYPSMGSLTNLLDDVEPDGMNNATEYALGGNPTIDDSATVLPAANVDSNGLNMVYKRHANPERKGLRYTVMTGTSLTDGNLTNEVPESGTSAEVDGFVTATNRISTEAANQAFMQLSIEFQ